MIPEELVKETMFILAQVLGGVAVVLGFASFIQKRKQTILVLQMSTALVFTAEFSECVFLPLLLFSG